MTPDRHARIHELFDSARELPAAERSAHLDLHCAGDADLRADVESLLAHDSPLGGTFDQPALGRPVEPIGSGAPWGGLSEGELGSHSRGRVDLPEAPPATIGSYRIISTLGEGGFGMVYLAEQTVPVKRQVALKVLKPGMDSKHVLARFDAERQALAMMDHESVARVFDAGTTGPGVGEGRPFFVMELVRGVPITRHCDTQRLSIPERLELFMKVCDAVQHAHQKGVIHRDLKPSNILVEHADGKAVPKVIDFGVAKALNQRLTERTLFTERGQLVGTPEYMSPEQAGLSEQDIDTRSDIYSLGVLLYELLTGTLPFDSAILRAAALFEVQRIIREVEPPKPSTRLSALTTRGGTGVTPQGEDAPGSGTTPPPAGGSAGSWIPEVAANRKSDVRSLLRTVRGDLDWIVMKCLEKDRARRYETASALAMEIQRHLNHEPVLAGPPSAAYRVGKFARRHRVGVIASSAVVVALVLGIAGTSWMALVATRAQKREAEQRTEAEKQRQTAEAIAKFQTDMLAAADPEKLLGDKVTVLQAMEGAVKELDKGSLKNQPLAEAGVRDTIGITLHGLSRYDDAEPNLRKSLEIRRAILPAGHPDIAGGLSNLAWLLQDRNKLAEAEPLFRESLEIVRASFPAQHPRIATSLNNLAWLLQAQNRPAEAEPLYREALKIRRAALPAGDLDVAISLNNLAGLLEAQNKPAEAEPLFREALRIRRAALPAGHPTIAQGLNNLALLLQHQNKPAEAEPLFREALEINRATLPAGHPNIANSVDNLAQLLQDQNKPAEAEPLFREALDIYRATLPAGHPDIAKGLNNLASLLKAQNKLAEAEPLLHETLKIVRVALPAGHPDIAASLTNLADLLQAQNKPADAEPLYREALEIFRAALPAGHPRIAISLSYLGLLLKAQNRLTEAEPLLREAIEIYRAAFPAGHPNIANGLNNLAGLLKAQNMFVEAEPFYREAIQIWRAALPPGHPLIATGLNDLASLLYAQDKFAEAEPLFREALQIRRTALPAKHRGTLISLYNLANLLIRTGRPGEAAPLVEECVEGNTSTFGGAHQNTRRALALAVTLYETWDKAELGKGYDVKAAEWKVKLDGLAPPVELVPPRSPPPATSPPPWG